MVKNGQKNARKWSKKCFRSCDGNSGLSHDLIFVEVSEWDDIVWLLFQFVTGLVCDNMLSTFEFNAV